MKFIHLSDLHIGKRVNGYSMLEDQEYILLKIRQIIDEEKPNGVIIAGDVYDKSVPSAEAVALFDSFLTALSKRDMAVFVISGNHDSAERISFASGILEGSGVYMSPVYKGDIKPIAMTDAFGDVNVYMLPFIKPTNIKSILPEPEREAISSYNDAVKYAIERMQVDKSKRNLLITHQFVTGAVTSESEELYVGGTENVDASVFDDFDYVALGHIHRPQKCSRDTVRYCGTPLKYSFSEASDKKSVTIVEMADKGDVTLRFVDLVPMRDLVELKGTYNELMAKSFYEGTTWQEDYVHITLTDEDDIPDAFGKLSVVYKYIMKLDYDNKRTRTTQTVNGASQVETKSPFELFGELFEQINNQEMTDEQSVYLKDVIESIGTFK